MNESSPERQSNPETFRDLFPRPEDWEALQGGIPRVFRNPDKPESIWLVVHVYENQPNERQRFARGQIVATRPSLPGEQIPMARLQIGSRNSEGHRIRRDIQIPSFMYRQVHGDTCDERSARVGGESYPRIETQEQYESFLGNLRLRGFQELKYEMNDSGFTLTPYAQIRGSLPLAKRPD